jgi:hypothetical protein
MGENGELLQIHHGKHVEMFQEERKMKENGGGKMGGKCITNGTG